MLVSNTQTKLRKNNKGGVPLTNETTGTSAAAAAAGGDSYEDDGLSVADIDQIDEDGCTPLHTAILSGNIAILVTVCNVSFCLRQINCVYLVTVQFGFGGLLAIHLLIDGWVYIDGLNV